MIKHLSNGPCQEIEQDRSRSTDPEAQPAGIWIKTAALIYVWVNFGMAFTVVSTTLPDLITRFNVTVEEMSRTLVASSVGGIIGGPLGVFLDRFHNYGDAILALMLFINALVVSLKPIIISLPVLASLNFIDGLVWTSINAAGNAMLVNLWGEQSGSVMQAMHFGYPLGAMLGPLIAYPFVSSDENHSVKRPYDYKDGSQIETAYMIIGASVLLNGVLFLVFQVLKLPTTGHGVKADEKSNLKWKDVIRPVTWSPRNARFGVVMVLAMMFFYFLQYGSMVSSAVYQVQFAVDSNFTDEQQGALLSSSTNMAGALGRAISIPVAKFVPVHIMLIVFVSGQALTGVLIAVWGVHDKVAFWVLSCLNVLFRDPIWPAGYSFTDRFILLFAIVVGILDVASRLSAALMSWLMGSMYTNISPQSIYYVSGLLGICLLAHLVLVNWYAFRFGDRYKTEAKLEDKVPLENEKNVDDVIFMTKL